MSIHLDVLGILDEGYQSPQRLIAFGLIASVMNTKEEMDGTDYISDDDALILLDEMIAVAHSSAAEYNMSGNFTGADWEEYMASVMEEVKTYG